MNTNSNYKINLMIKMINYGFKWFVLVKIDKLIINIDG